MNFADFKRVTKWANVRENKSSRPTFQASIAQKQGSLEYGIKWNARFTLNAPTMFYNLFAVYSLFQYFFHNTSMYRNVTGKKLFWTNKSHKLRLVYR